jgi:predicted enzyme related to lactoylglutathione lyase
MHPLALATLVGLAAAVPCVAAALDQVKAHGGSVVFGRQVIPGVVILGLFKDPAGNRMGLVEMDGDKPKVPPAR